MGSPFGHNRGRSEQAASCGCQARISGPNGPAWEAKGTIPADTPPEKVKARQAAFLVLVEGRIAALRASKGGRGVDLTQRQADALAGDWYQWFTSQHLDNPGSPAEWSTLREILWDRAALAPPLAWALFVACSDLPRL